MDYGEPMEGIVEYITYDIDRDGRFTQRNEKTTKAIFADDRGYYIKEEW